MLARTPKDLGLLIREERRRLGLDQHELAKRVGVSRQWIVEIEGGKPRAALGLVLRTLTALGLEIDLRSQRQSSEASAPAGTEIDLDEVLARARRRP
jgi:HTH-type transcriptional regulator/antitoxin HipB